MSQNLSQSETKTKQFIDSVTESFNVIYNKGLKLY